jgi:isoleucyl-tRNA synthetase
MKQVVQQINQFGKEEISKLEQGQAIEVAVDEETQKITKDDVEILSQDIEGWKVASSNSLTVALDISITGELQNEGIARELVNRIQNFRKDSGFDVTDKIDIELEKHEVLEKAVNENLTYIKSETLTASLIFAHQINDGVAVDFDNINTTIHIQKHK